MPYLKNFHPNGFPPFVCKFCTKNGTGRISAYNISCQKKYKERTRVTRYYNANHYRYAISCLNPSGFRANKLRWHLQLWYLVKNPNYVVPLLCTYRFRAKKGGKRNDSAMMCLYQIPRVRGNSPTEIDTKSGSIIERCKKGSVLHKIGSENEPSGCRDDPGCFFARSNET